MGFYSVVSKTVAKADKASQGSLLKEALLLSHTTQSKTMFGRQILERRSLSQTPSDGERGQTCDMKSCCSLKLTNKTLIKITTVQAERVHKAALINSAMPFKFPDFSFNWESCFFNASKCNRSGMRFVFVHTQKHVIGIWLKLGTLAVFKAGVKRW